jgi:ectoine hydroxylase-related dioxygenase (phytanoyl-CoA dioxygenase family)
VLLTEDQVDFYRTNGYLIIPDVLTPAQLDEGRGIIQEFVERSRSLTESDDVFDLEPGHTAERPAIRRLKTPAKQHPFFDGLIHSAPILDPLESVLGSHIRALGSKLNLKAAGVGSPVEWHQDLAFHPHSNDNLLAVGIAFDDCSLVNGCLLVMPGSHQGPVLDHHQDGYFVGAVDVKALNIDVEHATPVEMKAGSIEIHHVRMLHGSAPNTSPNPRRLLLFDMAAADAFPIGLSIGDLDAYNAQIVRGTPQQPRTTDQPPVRLPFPVRKTGTIFEVQKQLRESAFAGART